MASTYSDYSAGSQQQQDLIGSRNEDCCEPDRGRKARRAGCGAGQRSCIFIALLVALVIGSAVCFVLIKRGQDTLRSDTERSLDSLGDKDMLLMQQDQLLQAKDAALTEKDAALMAKDDEFLEKNRHLELKVLEAHQKTEELQRSNQQLQQKTQLLMQRDQDLQDKIHELAMKLDESSDTGIGNGDDDSSCDRVRECPRSWKRSGVGADLANPVTDDRVLYDPSAPTIKVKNLDDAGPDSLRAAIEVANAAEGPSNIVFHVPASSPGRIYLETLLPSLVQRVHLDGAYGNGKSVTLDGSQFESTCLSQHGAAPGVAFPGRGTLVSTWFLQFVPGSDGSSVRRMKFDNPGSDTNVQLDPSALGPCLAIDVIEMAGLTIDGCEFRGLMGNAAINTIFDGDLAIRNCRFDENADSIEVLLSSGVSVTNNVDVSGIPQFWGLVPDNFDSDPDIRNVDTSEFMVCIVCSDAVVEHNDVRNRDYGILLIVSSGSTIQSNYMTNLKFNGLSAVADTANEVYANNVFDRAWVGIVASNAAFVGELGFSRAITSFSNCMPNAGLQGMENYANDFTFYNQCAREDTVSFNDYQDADGGPNDLQNYPIIESASMNTNTGAVSIAGSFNSVPLTQFVLELFAVDAPERSASWPLGYVAVTTDANGDADYQFACTAAATCRTDIRDACLAGGRIYATAAATRIEDAQVSCSASASAVAAASASAATSSKLDLLCATQNPKRLPSLVRACEAHASGSRAPIDTLSHQSAAAAAAAATCASGRAVCAGSGTRPTCSASGAVQCPGGNNHAYCMSSTSEFTRAFRV